jgi:hypothetical protein
MAGLVLVDITCERTTFLETVVARLTSVGPEGMCSRAQTRHRPLSSLVISSRLCAPTRRYIPGIPQSGDPSKHAYLLITFNPDADLYYAWLEGPKAPCQVWYQTAPV